MGNRIISKHLLLILSIVLGWGMFIPASAQEEPVTVGPKTSITPQAKAPTQPEALLSDPSSALGSRLIQLPTVSSASVKTQMAQPTGGPIKIGFARDLPSLKSKQDTQTQLDWKPVTGGMVELLVAHLDFQVLLLRDMARFRIFPRETA